MDIIYVMTDNRTIVTYNTNRGGAGPYNDQYFVNISYNTSTERIYAQICDGVIPSIVLASGSVPYTDFSMEDIAVGRANGTGSMMGKIYEGNVDQVDIYFGDIGYGFFTTTNILLGNNRLYDSLYIEKNMSSDCNFSIDILDGSTGGLIPGLSNLSGDTIDISGINP